MTKVYRTRIRAMSRLEKKILGKLEKEYIFVDIGNESQDEMPRYRMCKWTNAHGKDVLLNDRLLTEEVATVTMPYDPRITSDTFIYKDENKKTYIINGPIDNIKDENREIEFQVKRYIP